MAAGKPALCEVADVPDITAEYHDHQYSVHGVYCGLWGGLPRCLALGVADRCQGGSGESWGSSSLSFDL